MLNSNLYQYNKVIWGGAQSKKNYICGHTYMYTNVYTRTRTHTYTHRHTHTNQ